jgi:tetratricopeptide (TPR) repeat protein
MKSKYLISLLVGSTTLLGGCTDMLDIRQKNVVGVDTFYKTDADAAAANVYMWTGFATAYTRADGGPKAMMDGDVWSGGGGRSDNASMERMNEYTFTSQEGGVSTFFRDLYTLIYRAHLIFENFEPDSDIKKLAIAEAKFFRALAYFDLVTMWGTPPLITKIAQNEDEQHQPNGDPTAIWALIESDLSEAIAMNILPSKAGLDDKIVRVTKETAQAVLGKAYLWQKRYGEAIDILDEVIASGKYDLYQGEYADILRSWNDFNRESMLERNRVKDPSNPNSNSNTLNYMHWWRTDKLQQDENQWLTNTTGVGSQGWGFNNPTKELYDLFVSREGVDGYRLNSVIWTYDQVLEKGVRIQDGQSLYGHEGYFLWKQRVAAEEKIQGMSFDSNVKIMRFAEVLLLAAEAHLMGGDAGKALEYVNRVRERAKLANLTTLTLEDLKIEKRLELFFENIRYQDLLRWGDAATALGNKGKNIPIFGHYGNGQFGVNPTAYTNPDAGFVAGKHDRLPFPYAEVSVNQNLTQNPGW